MVVASSSSVYGANPALPKREDMATLPVSPYAAGKLAAEAATLAYGRSFGLPVLAFRFFNVFGPLQPADHAYAAVVPAFVAAALRDEPIPVHGDGRQTRDFTFVGTCGRRADRGRRAAGDRPRTRSTWPSGPGCPSSSSSTGSKACLGRSLPRQHSEPRAGDVRDSQADQSRLRRLFPDIEPVDLEQGLRATVAWLSEER